jgi:predicted ATPase
MSQKKWEPVLLSISRKSESWPADLAGQYPFSVPVVQTLTRIDFTAPVTFLIGENGSGKSTLLEAIGVASEVPFAGSNQSFDDGSLASAQLLAGFLRLAWTRRLRQGMFMRAEDFFGYLKRRARDDARITRERIELDAPPSRPDVTDRSTHIDEQTAERLIQTHDTLSHGESFLELFASRVVRRGLFLLDEPEAPLSPRRQLALLSLLTDAVATGAQFIIATHSPILLSFPGAVILSCDESPMKEVKYDELDQVAFTREFLNAPERYLRHIRSD